MESNYSIVTRLLKDKSFILGKTDKTISIECQTPEEASALHVFIEQFLSAPMLEIDCEKYKIPEMSVEEYKGMIRQRNEKGLR